MPMFSKSLISKLQKNKSLIKKLTTGSMDGNRMKKMFKKATRGEIIALSEIAYSILIDQKQRIVTEKQVESLGG